MKQAKGKGEDAKVSVRNIRRKAKDELDALKSELGEDEKAELRRVVISADVEGVTLRWRPRPGMEVLPFRAPEGIRMVRIDRRSGRRVYGAWPTDDPKAAVIWEAFKPESEPRRTIRKAEIVERALIHEGRKHYFLVTFPQEPGALRRFLDDGAAVAGCDPDQLGIDVDPVVRDRGHLVAGRIESLPRTEGEHDLVYGVHVLEHVDDVGTTLAAARGLLRPGGQVQMLTPAGDSDGLRFHGESWWMLEDPTHVRFFSEHSLRRAAEAAGLVDIEIRRPVLDSLSADAASLVRRVRPAPRPGGVLGSRPALALAAASAPAVALARTVRPGLRTTLHLLARAPQGR